MTRRRIAALARAAGVALTGLAGRGGDDDQALSREELVAQADRIYAEGNARIEAAVPRGGAPGPAFYDVIVSETERSVDRVDALAAPEELRGDVDDPVAASPSALTRMREMSADRFLADDRDLFETVEAEAREIGLVECAGEEE